MVSVGIPNIVENAGVTLGQIAKVRSKVVKGRRAPFLDLVNARARYPKICGEDAMHSSLGRWNALFISVDASPDRLGNSVIKCKMRIERVLGCGKEQRQ